MVSFAAESQGPTSILVVDDLEENRMALRVLLERPDVRLLEAKSGIEALELLLVHTDVALALVDVQMPDMDGFELAELMRGKRQTHDIPIIFVTAGSRESYRVFRGYDAGAVDFLFKPIDARILAHKAEVFLRMYRQKRELALLSERLAAELRLNETFVAAVSHDLRNPLGAMLLASELVVANAESEKVKKLGERIRSSGRRMTRMIEDLLDLARARLSGGIPIEPTAVDLEPLARKVVTEHLTASPGRVVELACTGDAKGHFDGDRVEQVISNLIANALTHGARDEPVRVYLDGTPDEVVIVVKNRGSIPQEVLPDLFDPFRGGGVRSTGLGLGLYIVKQIVSRHGGRVTATSSDTEVTFRVELPRVGAQRSDAA